MDADSKDNANPTVLDASALPTRRGNQRARQRTDTKGNRDKNSEGNELAGDARSKNARSRGRRRAERSAGSSSNESNAGSGSGGSDNSSSGSDRSRLRNGRTKGNAFFDELLGASASRRGYLDEVLDGDDEEGAIGDGEMMVGVMGVGGIRDVEIHMDSEADDDDGIENNNDDDDDEGDEIDEQEIYGTLNSQSFPFVIQPTEEDKPI